MYEKDPEAYWKLLKDLKEESNSNDSSISISPEEWQTHFLDLYEIKPPFMARERYFQTYLDFLLSVKTFRKLGVKIKNK